MFDELLKKYLPLAVTSVLALFPGCLAGCSGKSVNLGEIGVRSSWALYHKASKEGAEDTTASVAIEVPGLLELVTGTDKPEDEVE